MPPQEQNEHEQKQRQRALLEREAFRSVQAMFKKEGLGLNESDIPTLRINKPGTPPFPILIVMLSGTKDLIDIFLGLPGDTAAATGIGLILTFTVRALLTAFTFIVGTVLFVWVLGRVSAVQKFVIKGFVRGGVGLAMKTKFVKKRLAQGTIGVITETIIPIIPFATIFVLLAHYDENKYVKLLLSAAEQIGKAYKGGKLKMKK